MIYLTCYIFFNWYNFILRLNCKFCICLNVLHFVNKVFIIIIIIMNIFSTCVFKIIWWGFRYMSHDDYCKIIIIRGTRIFVVFMGRSIHKFKIQQNFIPTNTSCHVSILYITNMHRRFSTDFCVMNAQRQGLNLLTSAVWYVKISTCGK
jgi:hypothetical protein